MRQAKIKTAIKDGSLKKPYTIKYCQKHCVDGIEFNGRVVCGFCRSVPNEIIHYHAEEFDGIPKTVFYKSCPLCGDIVRIVKDYCE